MNYKLLYTKHALKDIRKLDFVVQRRLKKHLEKASTNPLTMSEKLTDRALGSYRIRMGSYRVIFDLDTKGKIVYILRVGHRREIYR